MHEVRLYLVKEYRLRILGFLSDNPVACVAVMDPDQLLCALRMDSPVGVWRDALIDGFLRLKGRTQEPHEYWLAEYHAPFLPSEMSYETSHGR